MKGVSYLTYSRQIIDMVNSELPVLVGRHKRHLFSSSYCNVEHYDQIVPVEKMKQVGHSLGMCNGEREHQLVGAIVHLYRPMPRPRPGPIKYLEKQWKFTSVSV